MSENYDIAPVWKKNGAPVISRPSAVNFVTDADISASGSELTIPLSGSVGGYYGDGSDGDVIISVNTDLARDMYYDNLTINDGVILSTKSYRIFVKGTLTNNGTIECNGGDAGLLIPEIGGAAVAEGSLPCLGDGGDALSSGVAITNGIGVVGLGTSIFTALPAVAGGVRFVENAINAKYSNLSEVGYFYGNGTNGGKDWTGSGANGGFIVIVAKTLAGDGVIECNGGAGAVEESIPETGYDGNGGIMVLVYGSDTSTITRSLTGEIEGILMEFQLG